MAQFQSPILGSHISGSIGGANFYTHRGHSIVRSKPIPRNSISPKRCLCRNSLLNAQYWSNWIRTRPGVHRWQSRASNRTLNKFGIDYQLSVHQTVCLIQALNSRSGQPYVSPSGNATGVLNPTLLSLDILDSPSYAQIILVNPLPLYSTLFFWWSFPQHRSLASFSGGYPHYSFYLGPQAGPLTLSGARISGHAYIYYRWRTIDAFGRFSPISFGTAEKLAWI
jgi:hypothetical protein